MGRLLYDVTMISPMIDDTHFEEEEVVHRSVDKKVKQLDAILEEMKKQWNGIGLKHCFDENGVRRHVLLILVFRAHEWVAPRNFTQHCNERYLRKSCSKDPA